ncbi:hypothetical protein [Nocardioides sp.]|uniref:hypothetical protein n=1 Tax=Nocardioides sp. TaxID=35761 RepID=UPI002626FA02|nr:hypothetical protein [Nocardioides sp.]MDI6911785.1 hypothetical protein [Nocardioides sp.]
MADPTPDERDQPYDRWSRPQALSNRGYAIAAVVPFVIAAIGFGIVALVSSGDGAGSGVTVRLPTSGWAPASGGGDALIQGVLRLDDQRCVYLEAGQDGADPGKVWAVWPAGYQATREGDRLTLLDSDGNVVAHDGDQISTSGGFGPAGTFAGEPCVPASGEVAIVQSEVTATP